jgi:hypothetical protein
MNKKMRRSYGISFERWYGSMEKLTQKKLSYLVWRDFYNDNFTPEEALLKVGE